MIKSLLICKSFLQHPKFIPRWSLNNPGWCQHDVWDIPKRFPRWSQNHAPLSKKRRAEYPKLTCPWSSHDPHMIWKWLPDDPKMIFRWCQKWFPEFPKGPPMIPEKLPPRSPQSDSLDDPRKMSLAFSGNAWKLAFQDFRDIRKELVVIFERLTSTSSSPSKNSSITTAILWYHSYFLLLNAIGLWSKNASRRDTLCA